MRSVLTSGWIEVGFCDGVYEGLFRMMFYVLIEHWLIYVYTCLAH